MLLILRNLGITVENVSDGEFMRGAERSLLIREESLMYTVDDLIKIAKRENNAKRPYLMVNQLQGKYMPVLPGQALVLFGQLAELLRQTYEGEQILLIGFAETATAISAAAAAGLKCRYLQTTRENVKDSDYLLFSEEHSHATEQHVVKNDLNFLRDSNTRIIFVDDEVTTGKTILNIISLLRQEYGDGLRFSVASLLNCMEPAAKADYYSQGIALHTLVEADKSGFTERAEQFENDGIYHENNPDRPQLAYRIFEMEGAINPRSLTDGERYQKACESLWQQFLEQEKPECFGRCKILVLGTEEFMYPALYIAEKLEKLGMDARFYATTRGPVEVSRAADYPLHERYKLASLYDEQRKIYLYNPERYDRVYVFTDAEGMHKAGEYALINALADSGNEEIAFIYWH